MIVDTAGKITERIWLLGRKESWICLLDGGTEYALIGGGMLHIVPDISEQIQRFDIDERKITRLVILHAHFDHCGVAPYFKKRWPWVEISASARAKELLSAPEVIQSMENLSGDLSIYHKRIEEVENLGITFSAIEVEHVLKDQDVFHCGELEIEVMATPGHSTCSIALYAPTEKALFASDAGGVPAGDGIFCSANSNFDKFQQSLQKMARRDVEVYLPEHVAALTGENARSYLPKAIRNAAETRAALEDSLKRTGDIQLSAKEITDLWISEKRAVFLPRNIMELVVGQMLRYLIKQIH